MTIYWAFFIGAMISSAIGFFVGILFGDIN